MSPWSAGLIIVYIWCQSINNFSSGDYKRSEKISQLFNRIFISFCPPSSFWLIKRRKTGTNLVPLSHGIGSVTSDNNMAASAASVRLLRVKLSRLSLLYFHKSRPFITAILRFSSSNCSRWRRLCLPPRKSLHWGVAVGSTAGLLCGSVAFCASSGTVMISVIFVHVSVCVFQHRHIYLSYSWK